LRSSRNVTVKEIKVFEITDSTSLPNDVLSVASLPPQAVSGCDMCSNGTFLSDTRSNLNFTLSQKNLSAIRNGRTNSLHISVLLPVVWREIIQQYALRSYPFGGSSSRRMTHLRQLPESHFLIANSWTLADSHTLEFGVNQGIRCHERLIQCYPPQASSCWEFIQAFSIRPLSSSPFHLLLACLLLYAPLLVTSPIFD
jgi:hypothetical protein